MTIVHGLQLTEMALIGTKEKSPRSLGNVNGIDIGNQSL